MFHEFLTITVLRIFVQIILAQFFLQFQLYELHKTSFDEPNRILFLNQLLFDSFHYPLIMCDVVYFLSDILQILVRFFYKTIEQFLFKFLLQL